MSSVDKQKRKLIRNAAQDFIRALQDNGCELHPDVFVILSEQATENNLTLVAEQKGIQGTYIHFVGGGYPEAERS